MSSPRNRIATATATLIAALVLCVGCATPVYTEKFAGTAPDWQPPIVDESDFEALEAPRLSWASDGDSFYLVTWGSGSCPSEPTAITSRPPNIVEVTLESSRGTCTADIAATTFVIPVLAEIEPESAVDFWANGQFLHVLSARD